MRPQLFRPLSMKQRVQPHLGRTLFCGARRRLLVFSMPGRLSPPWLAKQRGQPTVCFRSCFWHARVRPRPSAGMHGRILEDLELLAMGCGERCLLTFLVFHTDDVVCGALNGAVPLVDRLGSREGPGY